jgi:CheY-like chemotaxis protein
MPNSSPQSQHNGIALIVEDEVTNRMILKALLKKRGYLVIEAENGIEAIQQFQHRGPDIIFMDVMMPLMDGYEATTEIKRLAGDQFVPIIFLTAMSDEEALARCVEVGGDDFLSKPYSFTVLSAKVKAMERIRTLHRDAQMLYSRMQRDEEIAEQVFSGAVIAGNVALEHIHSLLRPASVFSGDLMLTAFAPSRDLHLLLGDFTGHGLAAALGALPTSEAFRSMTAKGFAPQQILIVGRGDVAPVGVFLDMAIADVRAIAGELGLHWVQLHGRETPDDCAQLADSLQVIKALTADALSDSGLLRAFAGVAAALLCDGRAPGSGQPWQWHTIRELGGECAGVPIFLAGGLDPDNVEEAIRLAHPAGVDTASGVEQEGSMAASKVMAFCEAARRAAGGGR